MSESRKKIRKLVFAFSLVLAFMLYQTGDSSMGTIVALITMGMSILLSLLERHSFSSRGEEVSRAVLLCFAFVVFATTIVRPGNSFLSVGKFLFQVFLCLMLLGASIQEEEHRYLKYVLEVAAVVYSFLIIRYCMSDSVTRTIHGDIEMFGSSFDPNYIGIPLVLASVVLLDDFLKSTTAFSKGVFFLSWLFIALAIVQTSSRGNSLSFLFSNGLVLIEYFKPQKVTFKKVLLFLTFVLGAIIAFRYATTFFSDNLTRMLSYERGADNGRFELWKQSIYIWEEHPLFGVGLGGVTALGELCSHNTYLQVLAETGFIGFMFFSFFLFILLRKVLRYERIISIVYISLLFQIFFLNALDNRCFWSILCWLAMIPNYSYKKF